MKGSTKGLPVHHQLPEFTQTHVHQVGDAIQPSHPLSSPSLLPLIPPSIRVFSNESTLHLRWPKYWSFSFSISPSNEHPGLISIRMDRLDLLANVSWNIFDSEFPEQLAQTKCLPSSDIHIERLHRIFCLEILLPWKTATREIAWRI